MAYDQILASRVREVLAVRNDVTEKKMFGGLCFMVGSHMCCGITDELMLRVGPENYGKALAQRHARPMDFTGRPLSGFVFVDVKGLKTRRDLARWVGMALAFVGTLPPKAAKKAKTPKRAL